MDNKSFIKIVFDKDQIFILRQFIRFLKENNSLEYFCDNVKEQNGKQQDKKTLLLSMREKRTTQNITYYLINIIDRSFYWARTPQGHEYWKRLNERWRQSFTISKEKGTFVYAK